MTDKVINIRQLNTLDEMYEAVELQRIYWGDDLESLVPAHMLYTIASSGGHVIAAYDQQRMIGVLIGLIGTDTNQLDRPAMTNLLIASKRMVVLPEYRSGGIGQRLKLAQRDATIKQGIRLITWTFDPLRSANAYLNLRKLGGVCQKYHQNLYGTNDNNGLSVFGVSDRLRLDWWVTHRRVEKRLNGDPKALTLNHYLEGNATIVNPTQPADRYLAPATRVNMPNASLALLEIPLNFSPMIEEAPTLAHDWQLHIRELMTGMMNQGFIITDFIRETYEGYDRGFYLFTYNYGFDFSLN